METVSMIHEVKFTPSTRVLSGLEDIGRYLHVSRRTAWRWIQEMYVPAMQTPAGTWITTTSLIDLWILATSQARWDLQKAKGAAQADTLTSARGEQGAPNLVGAELG
jgi:hypothetical protein